MSKITSPIKDPVDVALAAAKVGIHVLPVSSGNKHALIKDWPNRATTDPETIIGMWQRFPNAMVGGLTGKKSGFFVFDVDVNKGSSLNEQLKIVSERFGLDANGFHVTTPSGGVHFYFSYPDQPVKNTANVVGAGLDIRGDGGYVVLPGSVRDNGESYQPAQGESVGSFYENFRSLPTAPDILLKATESQQKLCIPTVAGSGDLFREGGRNSGYTRLAGLLRRTGADEEAIFTAIYAMDVSSSNPLSVEELRKIAQSVGRYDVEPDCFSQERLARYLAKTYAERLLYCESKGFYVFEDGYWNQDGESAAALYLTRQACDEIKADVLKLKNVLSEKRYGYLLKESKHLEKLSTMKGALELLKTDPIIRVKPSDLDADKNLLNLNNGSLHLKTGELMPFSPAQRLTFKQSYDYDPSASCPNFDKFLTEVLPEYSDFILRIFGYALLGHGREQRFFIFQGDGQNGKSTLLDVMSDVFGSLALTIQPDSLNGKHDGQIRNDLARLAGKRLMLTSETKSGTVLDAPLLKQITGGDEIAVRMLHKEFFQFRPVCCPIIVTNYLPVFDGGDGAMGRRLCIVEFKQVVEKVDGKLPEKLKGELAGIFNRVLQGMKDYQQNSLSIPESVVAKTKAFIKQSDLLDGFVADCLLPSEKSCEAGIIYREYTRWALSNGYKPLSMAIFKASFERTTGLVQYRDQKGLRWPKFVLKPLKPRV